MDPTESMDVMVCGAARGPTHEARTLVVEAPLLITVGDTPVTTLMRTPGDDLSLALGWLKTEGIIARMSEVGAIAHCQDATSEATNVVRVTRVGDGDPSTSLPTHRRVFSSCSVCGAELIDELVRDVPPFDLSGQKLKASGVADLAERMRRDQPLFRATGGTHGAALGHLPLTADAVQHAIVREDVGRHNALDKVVGLGLAQGWNLQDTVLVVSSRLSYEMVAKAARAGIGRVAGVSAPTALAVRVARRLHMVVIGFVRAGQMTVYTGADALDMV